MKLTKHRVVHSFHEGEHFIHMAYCGFLYFGGHSLYAQVGGVLGVVIMINWIFHILGWSE